MKIMFEQNSFDRSKIPATAGIRADDQGICESGWFVELADYPGSIELMSIAEFQRVKVLINGYYEVEVDINKGKGYITAPDKNGRRWLYMYEELITEVFYDPDETEEEMIFNGYRKIAKDSWIDAAERYPDLIEIKKIDG